MPVTASVIFLQFCGVLFGVIFFSAVSYSTG